MTKIQALIQSEMVEMSNFDKAWTPRGSCEIFGPGTIGVDKLFRFTFKRVIANNQPLLMVAETKRTTTGGGRHINRARVETLHRCQDLAIENLI